MTDGGQPRQRGQAEPPPYAPAYAQPGPPQGLSIASMVTGIAGLVFLGLLGSIPAVIMGHLAMKREPLAKPFWLTGLITGYIGTVLYLVAGFFVLTVVLGLFAVLFSTGGFRTN